MKRRDESGYVLFGIAIGLVILGISMTAAVPLWKRIVQREREKELIFRGYQYMQAIELYQRKYPGAYPPNIEVLIEEKFLRREYADPFAESKKGPFGDSEPGKFRLIRQMSPELQQGAQQQQEAAARAAGITDLNRSRAQLRTPGQETSGISSSQRQPTGGRFQSAIGRGRSDAALGGIVGVASSSDEESFYQVPGKPKYKDWLFVYGAQTQAGQVQQVQQVQQAAVRPGQVGQRNQSPFPGLPPPPGLTSFRFGAAPAGPGGVTQQPGQALPGQPGGGVRPGQPQPGAPGQPGAQPPGFGPSQGFGGQPQQQPRQQNPRRQP